MKEHYEELIAERDRRIAELEKTEKKLLESESRYRRIFENSVVPIWNDDFSAVVQELNRLRSEGVEDFRAYLQGNPGFALTLGEKLRVIELNDATLELFKVQTEAQFSALIKKSFHEGAVAVFVEALCAIWGREESFTSEIVFFASDDAKVDAIISFRIPEEESYFCSVPVSIIDITGLKCAERELVRYQSQLQFLVDERTRELKTAQAELLQQERLAALGRLTATVSHELRNPLGTIQASICSLGASLGDHEGQHTARSLELAEQSIDRCVSIIEELNDYARVKSLCLSECSIDDWVREILAEIPLPDAIHYETALSSGVQALIDQEKLRQVLVNLINNAVHALEDERSEGKLLQVSTRQHDDHYEIRIQDDGIGMSQEIQGKIFEPLFSTKGFGVGLGMAIVRNIVEQHEGEVVVSSRPGDGACITLRLPVNLPQ